MDENEGVKVVVEVLNSDTRRYGVKEAITSYSSYRKEHFPIAFPDNFEETEGSREDVLLYYLQERVDGIETVTLERFRVTVVINRLFEWDEVDPGILDAIRDVVWGELCVSRAGAY